MEVKRVQIPDSLSKRCVGVDTLPPFRSEIGQYCMGYLSLMYVDKLLSQAKTIDIGCSEVVEQFTGVLNSVLESGVQEVRISRRFVRRRQDEQRLIEGEHPGVHIGIVTNDNVIVHVNFFGGIREKTCMDDHDTSNQHGKGLGHSNRTDAIGNKPLIVNLMVQPEGGQRLASCQLTIDRNNGKTVSFDRASVYKQSGVGVEVTKETSRKIRIEGNQLGDKFVSLADYMAKNLPMI